MNQKTIWILGIVIAGIALVVFYNRNNDPEPSPSEALPETQESTSTPTEEVDQPTPSANTSEATSTPPVTKTTPPTQITPPPTTSPTIVKRLLPQANSAPRTTPITHVMLHFVSNVTAKPRDPHRIDDIINIFKSTGLSSHYIIGRDGTIYQLTEENRVAYHGGKGSLPAFPTYTDKINLYSIGIEIAAIGTKEEMSGFISGATYDSLNEADIGYTAAQYASIDKLLESIYTKYPSVKKDRLHVIGHDEYAPDRKFDPGTLFDWSRIGF